MESSLGLTWPRSLTSTMIDDESASNEPASTAAIPRSITTGEPSCRFSEHADIHNGLAESHIS